MNDGKGLESHVAMLLRASGYEVRTEELLGTKRVDLVAETTVFGKRRIFAVECKDYAESLTREHVARIVAEYSDLRDKGHVDELLLVTRTGLTPTAAGYVRDSKGCAHQTLGEVERSVIDFSQYLASIIAGYEQDHVSSYYVSPRTTSGDDLESLVSKWLESQGDVPLAILGGYGMGKTTFASHYAASLARQAVMDPMARVPILLPLGLISSEQTIDGLLGRAFTSIHQVPHYSFNAFDTMNRLGKLAVFLDGFDEMKHTLTWHEFKYNFQQLLRLVVPGAKVIILGRPTAFMSDQEQRYILHGTYSRGGRDYGVPDWPDFREIEIAPFDSTQVEAFLSGYFHKSSESLAGSAVTRTGSAKSVRQVQRGLESKHIRDLAHRPVQLRMLAEVLPAWSGDLSRLSVATLYDHFIDRMILRELGKASRQRFDHKARRRFAREVAWWLWTAKNSLGTSPDAIPDSIISPFVSAGEDIEAVRRDLVSACFLEKKLDGTLYFPHRSFQEYLVAEMLNELLESDNVDVKVLSAAVFDEVGGFFAGLMDPRVIMRWIGRIAAYRGIANMKLFEKIAENEVVAHEVLQGSSHDKASGDFSLATKRSNPWYGYMVVLVALRHAITPQTQRATIDYFIENIGDRSAFHTAIFNMFCAVLLASAHEDRIDKELIRVIQLCKERFDKIITASSDRRDGTGQAAGGHTSSGKMSLEELMEESIDPSFRYSPGAPPQINPRLPGSYGIKKFIRETGMGGEQAIDIENMLKRMAQLLRPYAMFAEWSDARSNLASDSRLPKYITPLRLVRPIKEEDADKLSSNRRHKKYGRGGRTNRRAQGGHTR